MKATYCACILANLEGLNNIPSKDSSFTQTLAALDKRAQKLEAFTPGLLAPPPVAPLTWDSLIWRVARLSTNSNRFTSVLKSAPEVPLCASLDLIDSIIASINNAAPGSVFLISDAKWGIPIDKGGADDEKTVCDEKDADERRLDVLRQRLCYAVGKRGDKIDSVPYDLQATCSLALYLSLDIEKSNASSRRPPGMNTKGMVPGPPRDWGGAPPRPVNTTIEVTKPCRRTCCRKENRRKKTSIGSRIGGFFRKLAWWKGKKDTSYDSDSDSSCGSYTTSSSGTSIVDL